MSEAAKILTVADRTPKERRDMAELYAVDFEWQRDVVSCRFADGSALMMRLDDNLSPVEMIEVAQ